MGSAIALSPSLYWFVSLRFDSGSPVISSFASPLIPIFDIISSSFSSACFKLLGLVNCVIIALTLSLKNETSLSGTSAFLAKSF